MAPAPPPPRPPSVRLDISLRSLLLALCVIAGAWVVIKLIPVLLVIVGGLIFAGTLDPAVQWLEAHRFRRTPAVALVFGSAVIVVIGLGLMIIPPLWEQLVGFIGTLPKLQTDLVSWLGQSRLLQSAAESVRSFDPKPLLMGPESASKLVSGAGGAVEVLGYLASSVVLSLYLVSDRERARGTLFSVVPRGHHVRLARVLTNLGTIVGGYMRGQLITSAAIFVFAFGLLSILKVPGALALAGFAALTDVIPFVGGLLATTPATLAALAVDRWSGVAVLVAMVLYQEFESRVLVPRIYGRTLRMSSAAVIIALLIGGRLLGILGALLALPVAAALRMMIEELRVELPGDSPEDPAVAATDARAQAEYERKAEGAHPEEAAAEAGEIADKVFGDHPTDPKPPAK